MFNENVVYNENCLDTMKRFDDDSINLIITSPPYNMNLRIMKGKYCSRQILKKEFSTKYDGFDDNLPIDEYYHLHHKIISEMLRISPIIFYNIQIVTGSKRAIFKLIGDFSEQLKDIIVWKKTGQPAMQSGVLNRSYELILVFDKYNAISRKFDICNFERGTLSDVWEIPRGKKDKLIIGHGATFPKELVTKILDNFSNQDFVVYDPFGGCGEVSVCCKERNIKSYTSEISKKYSDIIIQRLNQLNKDS